MEEQSLELTPGRLDSTLRVRLGRRLVIIGLTPPAAPPVAGAAPVLGAPPAEFVRALEPYDEVWVRWLAGGTALDQALTHAALHEADVVLLWLAAVPTEERPAALVAFLEHAEAAGARDQAVIALVGPGASRALAHRLGFDEGFGAEDTPGHVVSALAGEALAREQLRRTGSSPPCYL